MACSTIFHFFLFYCYLRSYIFQSSCEVMSFSMMSLHVDLNEAAKCVDNKDASSVNGITVTGS